jgi:hypothetical protein
MSRNARSADTLTESELPTRSRTNEARAEYGEQPEGPRTAHLDGELKAFVKAVIAVPNEKVVEAEATRPKRGRKRAKKLVKAAQFLVKQVLEC